jgi:exportin-5
MGPNIDWNRHRARDVDPYIRQSRLQEFLRPVLQSWRDENFTSPLSSFDGFCHLLGLENVGQYLRLRNAQQFEDWSLAPLDEEGKMLQKQMNLKFQVS